MPRNSKTTVRSFHASSPTIFEKKNSFSSGSSAPTLVAPVPSQSLSQTLKEGFAFGAGSSIARTMIESAFSRMGPQVESAPVPPLIGITKEEIAQCKQRALSNKCDTLADSTRQAWVLCMKDTKFDDSLCDTTF
jgi:hypothetical protein